MEANARQKGDNREKRGRIKIKKVSNLKGGTIGKNKKKRIRRKKEKSEGKPSEIFA